MLSLSDYIRFYRFTSDRLFSLPEHSVYRLLLQFINLQSFLDENACIHSVPYTTRPYRQSGCTVKFLP